MRAVNIHGHEFQLANKWEVTTESIDRVENLIPRLFFAKINPAKSFVNETSAKGKGKGKDKDKNKENEIDELFADLLKDPEKFVEFLRLMSGDKTIEVRKGAMLTTGMDYSELIKLPGLVLQELIEESEKEIGKPEDFIKAFNLNTSMNPLDMLNNLKAISTT
jgi:hypothetical protein